MSKGISLHIGVNKVDPYGYRLSPKYNGRHYVVLSDEYNPIDFDCKFELGFVGTLSSCELDAENMYKLATSQKFNATILKTKKATSENVEKYIRRAAKQLVAGDTFFLSYAGHGSQVEDLSGDERDGEDETWCLYDRMFLDDEQRELYAEFAKGVKIVVLSDSCHSGSATRSGGPESSEELGFDEIGELRMLEERTAARIYKRRKKEYDDIQRGLKHPPPKLKASRILLSACQDHETAKGFRKGGVFTLALMDVMNGENKPASYGELAKEIRNRMQSNFNRAVDKRGGDASRVKLQVPNFVRIKGSSQKALDEFINQPPFEI